MTPPTPKRPYVPNQELPGVIWHKAEAQLGMNGLMLIGVTIAVLVLVMMVCGGGIFLSGGGGNLAVIVGLVSATPSQTPTNTPTPTITPTPAPPNSDDDAIIDERDNCDFVANPDQLDSDDDSIGDACDDSDADTIVDGLDNCPTQANTEQSDLDGDGLGDVCDETVNLEGITLVLDQERPLYVGSSQNSVLLRAEGDYTQPLLLDVSSGGFVSAEMTCISNPTPSYNVSLNERAVRYCAPSTTSDTQVRVIVREMDSNDQPTGKGGFASIELRQDAPSISFEQAQTLNQSSESTQASRCYVPQALGNGTLLEAETIPFVLRVSSQTDPLIERSYPLTLTLPSGSVYIARNNGTTCDLLTALEPLTGSPNFDAQLNTQYTLFYVPDLSVGDIQANLSVSLANSGQTPTSTPIFPILVATIPLNVRDSNLGVALTMETDVRATILGVDGAGGGRWVQIRVDNDERDLWLNVGQLGGSYRVIGDINTAPSITLPSNFTG
jgi:hypothetical protein